MAKRSQFNKKSVITLITAVLCIAVFTALAVFGENSSVLPMGKGKSTEDYVRVIDVGQGDSTLIYSRGYSVLIDTGPAEGAGDLLESLYASGIESIDMLILSHLHIDHTGGVAALFEAMEVKNLILPELSTYSEGIDSAQLAINKVAATEGGIYSAKAGMNFQVGSFDVTVLASYGSFSNENNRSLAIMVRNGERKFLFTGDMEESAEKRLLRDKIILKCDVLKVGHHGSSSSSSLSFLKKASPQIGVISCGEDNSYGHPHKEILERFSTQKIKIYRTDTQGDITFYVENEKIRVVPEK